MEKLRHAKLFEVNMSIHKAQTKNFNDEDENAP